MLKKVIFLILLAFLLIASTAYCMTPFENYLVVAGYSPNIGCSYKAQLLYTYLRAAGIPEEKVYLVYGDYESQKHLWVICEENGVWILYDPSVLTTHSGFPIEQYPDYKEIRRFKGNYDLVREIK